MLQRRRPPTSEARPATVLRCAGSCAWVSKLGCLETINNGPEGLKLIENRVRLDACVAYNSEGPAGCPPGGAQPPLPPRQHLPIAPLLAKDLTVLTLQRSR